MTNDSERYFLHDLGQLLRERALQAKAERDESLDTAGYDLKLGQLMAFHEVLSLMVAQAEAFGLSASVLALDNFEPDQELL